MAWTYLSTRGTVFFLVVSFRDCMKEEEEGADKTTVFEVEHTPLFYICEHGYYLPALFLQSYYIQSNVTSNLLQT